MPQKRHVGAAQRLHSLPERPSKRKRQIESNSMRTADHKPTPTQEIAGSSTNPIILDDDHDDVHEGEANMRLVASMRARPHFLLLHDLLQYTLDMLPANISREYVFDLCYKWGYKSNKYHQSVCQRIIESIAAMGGVPQETAGSGALQLPDDPPNSPLEWKDNWRHFTDPETYASSACNILGRLSPKSSSTYIKYVFISKGCLYFACLAIATQVRQGTTALNWHDVLHDAFCFNESQQPKITTSAHSQLRREFESARNMYKSMAATALSFGGNGNGDGSREESNQEIQALLECNCCSTDVTLDQIVYCSGMHSHSFCHTCMQSYVNTLIGNAKCRPVCFAIGSDCRAPIHDQQLRQCLLTPTLDFLLGRQLQEYVKKIGLDLQECPFCDYAEEIDADYTDETFVCKKTTCLKSSCRKCQVEAHPSKTCEQARAERDGDKYLTQRLTLEESMTKALMRQCNKCKTPFVKESGCNKMTCPNCRNVQCYICGKHIDNYSHFKGKCVLHDPAGGVEARHLQDVTAAREATLVKIRLENPFISEEALNVQVSAAEAKASALPLDVPSVAPNRQRRRGPRQIVL